MSTFPASELLGIVYESQIRGEVADVVGDLMFAVEQWHHEEEKRIQLSELLKVCL